MTERKDQRICIKFCYKLEKTCAETIEMLQKAFGEECMGKTQIKEWYKRFKNGRTSVESGARSGRPSKSAENVKRVRLKMKENRNLTIRELANELGIPRSTVSAILNKKKIPHATRRTKKIKPGENKQPPKKVSESGNTNATLCNQIEAEMASVATVTSHQNTMQEVIHQHPPQNNPTDLFFNYHNHEII